MKLNREQMMTRINDFFKDKDDDDTLSFISDLSDSFNPTDTEDWKKRYEDNDAQWRKKYRDRFFSAPVVEDDPEPEPEDNPRNKEVKFEDIFTKRKK